MIVFITTNLIEQLKTTLIIFSKSESFILYGQNSAVSTAENEFLKINPQFPKQVPIVDKD